MPVGLQAFLSNGAVVLDTNSRLITYRGMGTYTVPVFTYTHISVYYPGVRADQFMVSGLTNDPLYASVSSWVTQDYLHFSKDVFSAGEIVTYHLYHF